LPAHLASLALKQPEIPSSRRCKQAFGPPFGPSRLQLAAGLDFYYSNLSGHFDKLLLFKHLPEFSSLAARRLLAASNLLNYFSCSISISFISFYHQQEEDSFNFFLLSLVKISFLFFGHFLNSKSSNIIAEIKNDFFGSSFISSSLMS